MAERTLSNEKIFPMWNSTIVSYKTDDKGELEAVMLKDMVEGDVTNAGQVRLHGNRPHAEHVFPGGSGRPGRRRLHHPGTRP